MVVDWGLTHTDIEGIESIGVDEMAPSKGYKYFAVVYQIDQGMRRLIWIGSDRTEKNFHEFFDWLDCSRCSKIKAVCSDMWKAYLKVIEDRIPNALHILDRIAQRLNKVVDKLRAFEHKKLIADGYDSVIFKSRCIAQKAK